MIRRIHPVVVAIALGLAVAALLWRHSEMAEGARWVLSPYNIKNTIVGGMIAAVLAFTMHRIKNR